MELPTDAALARAYVAFRVPAYGTDAFYAADVAAHLLGSGRASRLYKRLVRERQLPKDITAFTFRWSPARGRCS